MLHLNDHMNGSLKSISSKKDALKFLQESALSKEKGGKMYIYRMTHPIHEKGIAVVFGGPTNGAWLIPANRIIDPFSRTIEDNQKMVAVMIRNIIKYGDRLDE